MSKVLVLGAGMVGSAMAIDLQTNHEVSVADINEKALQNLQKRAASIQIHQADLSSFDELKRLCESMDIVLSAVPGFMGYKTLENLINLGMNVVDISFFPEDAFDLDKLARDKGVSCFVDFGVAPGMDNLILGRYNKEMEVESFECYVGGLPLIRKWPFNYLAPFSPVDVIEEYTRPARFKENGVVVVKEALSDVESMEFEGVGTLEAFNSDGLRSILKTMSHIPNMIEKTLRYPGHVEYIRVLKESGFFENRSLEINGQSVNILDFTSKVLFNEWHLGDQEELTVMRVIVKGERDGVYKRVDYELLDHYDKKTKTASMSRTTGYTATAMLNYFAENSWPQQGIFPGELVGANKECFDYILAYLKERGVHYKVSQH